MQGRHNNNVTTHCADKCRQSRLSNNFFLAAGLCLEIYELRLASLISMSASKGEEKKKNIGPRFARSVRQNVGPNSRNSGLGPRRFTAGANFRSGSPNIRHRIISWLTYTHIAYNIVIDTSPLGQIVDQWWPSNWMDYSWHGNLGPKEPKGNKILNGAVKWCETVKKMMIFVCVGAFSIGHSRSSKKEIPELINFFFGRSKQ